LAGWIVSVVFLDVLRTRFQKCEVPLDL